MRSILVTVVLATLGITWATPTSMVISRRQDSVDSAPAECNFSNIDTFVETNNQGNNWCMRGYYAEGDIGCHDNSAGSPKYYTQADYPYCTCHSVAADSQGRHPVSVGIWFKGIRNPQWIDINTSDIQADDGRCYSYVRSDGTVQANGILPHWSTGGVQFACLWLNHTNVPEEVIGFSSRKYIGNPECPYS
ncbi:hypothetical protein F4821DRAFT_252658 [Hypoxylon rubiginosum]|uniref:Uncharacterized protein n=1 Tax=Hypoxylon rubiginosum TaxID=110542 RepID=A0ACC0DMD3_9PEZI|nr:hypothetical protein F4821DRAFT_252658 [Hypoxylon rubiginosum]